jgi:hypothetical protein
MPNELYMAFEGRHMISGTRACKCVFKCTNGKYSSLDLIDGIILDSYHTHVIQLRVPLLFLHPPPSSSIS